MGLAAEEAASMAADQHRQQHDRDLFNAPMRLQNESYADFSRLIFHSAAADLTSSQTSVAEDLRQLGINPEVFYGAAQRLSVSSYSPEALDPTVVASLAGAAGEMALAPEHRDEIPGPEKDGSAAEGFLFTPATRWTDSVPPKRVGKLTSPTGCEDSDPCCSLNVPENSAPAAGTLNLPDDDIEELPFEEITFNATRGGRLGHETPRGLSAKLQIDSLTDDEGDEDLEPPPRPQPDNEDAIEAFALDQDFDYEAVTILSRRV